MKVSLAYLVFDPLCRSFAFSNKVEDGTGSWKPSRVSIFTRMGISKSQDFANENGSMIYLGPFISSVVTSLDFFTTHVQLRYILV
jgi:hypothetical protein